MARKAPARRPTRQVADEPSSSVGKPEQNAAERPDDRRPTGRYFLALLAVVAAGTALLVWLDGRPKRRSTPRADSSASASNNSSTNRLTSDKAERTAANGVESSETDSRSSAAEAGAAVSDQELARLVGRWLRQDGGYVLKIKEGSRPDKLDVAYLNPNEIHVERAEAARRNDTIRVTIELRDVNYPGCLYELSYDQAGDRLRGTYFQAALGETYDVEFVREP